MTEMKRSGIEVQLLSSADITTVLFCYADYPHITFSYIL